ncbi:hypothetical protein OG943_22305 [Amycolatopsis sp. NBC_00345]|uniref:hypothetical protein n=1 Tax=Amycolatopsis sp. NBC_00345 TaxID=2975955 RepID=UPI002E25A9AF
MTTPVSPAEVAAANLAGRLHPSQRGKVLDVVFWTLLIVGVAMVLLAVILPLTTDVFSGAKSGQSLAAMPFVVLLAVLCLFLCWRRYRDLHRPLILITGWTHDFGKASCTDEYPIGMRFESQGIMTAERRELRAGGKTYLPTREMWALIQPNRNNTLCILPRSKLLVNVIPS